MVELQEFFVEGGDPNRSHVLLHITEPSTREEQAKGVFFALCEINNGTNANSEQLQQIIDLMESSYYAIPDSDTDAFELCLEEANRRGHHVLRKHPDTAIHCLVGTIRDHHIAFAYHGKPLAALYYSSGENTGHIDIIGEDEPPPQQLFSSLMQGDMNPGDFFYGATPHVAQFLATDRVEKIVFGRSAKQSVQHMEKVLTGLHNGQSYGGFLVHAFSKDGARVIAPVVSPPAAGSTATPLIETVPKNSSETKPAAPKIVYETNYRPRRADDTRSEQLTLPGHILRALLVGVRAIVRVIVRLALALWHGIVGGILILTNIGGHREIVLDNFRHTLRRRKDALGELSLLSKLFILIIILGGITFVAGIGYLRIKERRDAAVLAYQTQIQAITDKKNEADAKLIYGDESAASALVTAALTGIAKLPNNSPAEKDTVTKLQSDIAGVRQRLQKMVIVNPTLITDLGSIGGTVTVNALALLNQSLVIYGNTDPRHYIFDLTTSAIETKDHSAFPHLTADSTPKEHDTIIFGNNFSGIAAFDKDSHVLIPKDVSFPETGERVTDLMVYNQKLYSLDAAAGQIYKHNPTQTGYDKGSPWIRDAVGHDLTQGVAFGIDGDIYVLRAQGELIKLTAGTVVPFSITNLIPALTAPTRLITNNTMTALYILEPIEKRLIAVDKASGHVLKQYTTPLWQSPSDMLIDSEKNSAYVLDGNKLYRFDL